jgi:hypothetical protein
MSSLIKHIDEPAQLTSVVKLAGRHPASVYGLTYMTGGRAVKALGKSRDAGRLAKAARRGSRTGKTIAKAFSALPDWMLAAAFLISIGMATWIIASWLPKRRRHRPRPRLPEPDIPLLTQRVE